MSHFKQIKALEFSMSKEHGNQAIGNDGNCVVAYKPADATQVAIGNRFFVTNRVVFTAPNGKFRIELVDFVVPPVPAGTFLEVTFQDGSDGLVGTATHAGQLVRVVPTNPVAIRRCGGRKFMVRVKRINRNNPLLVQGEAKETITTKRGRIVTRTPLQVST
jgi:hypothetical protein